MFGWIAKVAQALASNPQLAQVVVAGSIHIPRAIERLSPESKQKLANIVRWGVEQAARHALKAVLGDVGNRVIDQVVNNQQVADIAKALVQRGIAVGVEQALKEARLSDTTPPRHCELLGNIIGCWQGVYGGTPLLLSFREDGTYTAQATNVRRKDPETGSYTYTDGVLVSRTTDGTTETATITWLSPAKFRQKCVACSIRAAVGFEGIFTRVE
jgi:hypothetical protein